MGHGRGQSACGPLAVITPKPGTRSIADALEAMAALPLLRFTDIGLQGLLVIAPHPDDESLGCGGMIAAACAARVPVTVLIVSDGAGSHPNSAAYPPDRLRAVREAETLEAAAELGLASDRVTFLRLPDRFVPSDGAQADATVATMIEAARVGQADTLAVTWRHDPHCDHQAAFELARRAQLQLPGRQLLAYPIWGLSRPGHERIAETEIRGFRLAIGEHMPAKRRAIAAHRSQTTALIDDDPSGFRLTPADLARFDGPSETFLKVTP